MILAEYEAGANESYATPQYRSAHTPRLTVPSAKETPEGVVGRDSGCERAFLEMVLSVHPSCKAVDAISIRYFYRTPGGGRGTTRVSEVL